MPHKRSCLVVSYTHSITRLGLQWSHCWTLKPAGRYSRSFLGGLRARSTYYGFYIRRHPSRTPTSGRKLSMRFQTSPGKSFLPAAAAAINYVVSVHEIKKHAFGTALLRSEAHFFFLLGVLYREGGLLRYRMPSCSKPRYIRYIRMETDRASI